MKTLFIFAHMDDETILSYGTAKKLKTDNHTNSLLTICGYGRVANTREDMIKQKIRFDSYNQNVKDVYDNVTLGRFYDLCIEENKLKYLIEQTIRIEKPDVIITHSDSDIHFEHKLVFNTVLLSTRFTDSFKTDTNLKSLVSAISPTSYWSYGHGHNININKYVDISGNFIKGKEEALRRYEITEMNFTKNDIRSTDSILLFNKMHGRTIHADAAEVYEVIYELS